MNKTETHRRAARPSTREPECCTDAQCESGLRNNYFEGKRLTPDSFRVEQRYLVERRRLLNRAIHGWGVVYGFAFKVDPPNECEREVISGRFEIGPGMALDECGRELLHPETVVRGLDDIIVLDEKGARIRPSAEWNPEAGYKPVPGSEPARPCWLLSAHYAELAVGPVTINDPCSCERTEWDRVCETVRFSLRRVNCAACCAPFDCEMNCDCATGPCCDERAKDVAEQRGPEMTKSTRTDPVMRGGCQCLCEHLTGLQPGADCGSLCEIEEPCARVRVDLRHGIPLACVGLRQDECKRWAFDNWVEACGPRRLVKRNDVLFDLIRGCDLTRISGIGWNKWHRSRELVHWPDFQKSFGTEDPPKSGRNITLDYWVEFSRPVRGDTVRADCFSMTVIVADDEAGWGEVRRVPIIDVVTSAAGPNVPKGHITRATLVVDAGWVDDATESRKTIFNQDEALVEIEIRGDFIVDCNGQTVDANAVGLSPYPTGNGAPGGTFCSSFRVEARESAVRSTQYDTGHRAQGVQP